MTCRSPGSVSPEDLMAFVDREAPPSVVAHVEACPACAAEVRSLGRLQGRLRRRLHRFDCPSPQILGDYHLDLLDPVQRQGVAAHLIECPRCREEVQTLWAFLADDAPVGEVGPLESALGAARRAIASLVSPGPGLAYAGLRGGAGASQTFRAGDVAISIGLGPPDRRGHSSISGLIASDEGTLDRFAQRPVRLQSVDAVAGSTVVDDLGNFELDAVAPGVYSLELDLSDQTVVIEEIRVEE